MCGIAGFYSPKRDIPVDKLRSATGALAHRGPDDCGVEILSVPNGAEIGLGNRRLAIVDLSPAGHQPMTEAASGSWIAYNGEVYNFAELRAELAQRGHRFVSNTDTEVLLKSYDELGPAAFNRWRGMFAAGIWDARRHKLVLVRDRLGIKPLYYSTQGANLVFASEVRALLVSGLAARTLSLAGVLSFLTWGSVQDPLTIVDGVYSLLPGHYLEFDGSAAKLHQYWDLPQPAREGSAQNSYRELVEDTRALLDDAVRLRLISDVPLGAFLSGGIDSSAVVALMCRHSSRVRTFSIAFSERSHDESQHARTIAERYGTEHHELVVSEEDVIADLPQTLQSMDQPTIDGVNTYFVSRATRRAGVTVALSGLGGDEVFGGYKTFRQVPLMQDCLPALRLVPSGLKGVAEKLLQSADTERFRKLGTLISGDMSSGAQHPYLVMRELYSVQEAARLLTSDAAAALVGDEFTRASRRLTALLQQSASFDAFNAVSCLELRTYMANTLLRDTDAMSMAHSLEVRVPLLDHKLVEYVLAIPGHFKTGATPKRLLVDAVGDLPDSIVHRKKFGFSFPWEHWLHGRLRSSVEPALMESSASVAGVLDRSTVRQHWRDYLDGRRSWSRPWAVFVLSRWCEQNLRPVGQPAIVAAPA